MPEDLGYGVASEDIGDEEDPALMEQLLIDAIMDGVTLVANEDTSIFDSCTSADEIGSVTAGDVVTASGPVEQCEDVLMVPVQPTGAVRMSAFSIQEEEVEDVAAEPEEAEELATGNAADDTLGDEEGGVQEHLSEGIEGSLRLKRMLTRDQEDAGPDGKRRKVDSRPKETAKAQGLLRKWALLQDGVVAHVLDQLPIEELTALETTNYTPDRFNQWKSPAELLTRYVCELRERKFISGGPVDTMSAFKFRWKIDAETDKLLRTLTHKELRYVMTEYDGTVTMEEVVSDAQAHTIEDENITVNALPDGPGVETIGRFCRLELIDPLADCAVFGDANLTFSMKLAQHRKALGHVGRVIATTFEEIDTLRERYKEIDQSIAFLEEHYAEVYHGVDCTRIAVNPQFEGLERSLGAVYYNFPHSGAIQGFFDGHPLVNWRHENLMRLFFRALRLYVKTGGIVKVASNMSAVGVRYSYIVGGALENEFVHVETMPFLQWNLHRYGRSYGDRRDSYKRPDEKKNQSYNAQRADSDMVYSFRYAPTGKAMGPQMVRLPPTLKTLLACTDGPFKHLQGMAKQNLAKSLHARFVTEVSGTHVG